MRPTTEACLAGRAFQRYAKSRDSRVLPHLLRTHHQKCETGPELLPEAGTNSPAGPALR